MRDIISRQAAIAAFKPYALYDSNRTNAEWVRRIELVLEELPSAEKHGKWVPRIATGNIALIECSECRFHYPEVLGTFSFYYCPHCGAKMDL